MSARSVEVVLRDGSAQDAPAVADVERRLFGADAWPETLVTAALAARTVVLAETGGELVGYAVLAVAGDVADLERIAVVGAHRRAGLASALLGAVRGRAVGERAERLLLEVSEANTEARAFYAAQGSVELGRRRRYYRDGSDALVLELPLVTAREENGG